MLLVVVVAAFLAVLYAHDVISRPAEKYGAYLRACVMLKLTLVATL